MCVTIALSPLYAAGYCAAATAGVLKAVWLVSRHGVHTLGLHDIAFRLFIQQQHSNSPVILAETLQYIVLPV